MDCALVLYCLFLAKPIFALVGNSVFMCMCKYVCAISFRYVRADVSFSVHTHSAKSILSHKHIAPYTLLTPSPSHTHTHTVLPNLPIFIYYIRISHLIAFNLPAVTLPSTPSPSPSLLSFYHSSLLTISLLPSYPSPSFLPSLPFTLPLSLLPISLPPFPLP